MKEPEKYGNLGIGCPFLAVAVKRPITNTEAEQLKEAFKREIGDRRAVIYDSSRYKLFWVSCCSKLTREAKPK